VNREYHKWQRAHPHDRVVDSLPNLQSRYARFTLVTGEHDMCPGENSRMAHIMGVRGVPNYLDVWKNGTGHDWPWWHQMARKFM
jgi:esterase/lipase superfamily enzyme